MFNILLRRSNYLDLGDKIGKLAKPGLLLGSPIIYSIYVSFA
jgi:hypothetical protein